VNVRTGINIFPVQRQAKVLVIQETRDVSFSTNMALSTKIEYCVFNKVYPWNYLHNSFYVLENG